MYPLNPYRGLSLFSEEDSSIFFGREDDVERSIKRLLENHFLAIIGSSGIGKSSLIRAGIIPQLKAKHRQIQPIVVCRFGVDPIANLASAVSEISADKYSKSTTALLIIDQFEELYTINDDFDRQNVLSELVALVDNSAVVILISIRADFMGRLFENRVLAKCAEKSAVFLSPLSPDSLRSVIINPAQIAGIKFEAGLPDRIMSDIGTDTATLPILQMLLNNLVETDDDGVITLADYLKNGAVLGTLEQTMENIWNSATLDNQGRIRRIMLRLVSVSEGMPYTRRIVLLDDFSLDERPLVEHLVSKRILVLHESTRNNQIVVEVAHEAIFNLWTRFSTWVDEERKFLVLLHRILDAANIWDEYNRDSSYLLAGGLLDQAKEILNNRSFYLSEREVAFIRQSISANERLSAWKLITGGLGLAKLQKDIIERDERRIEIQEQLHALDYQLQQLEVQKVQLARKLESNKHEVEAISPKVFLSYAREDFSRVKPLYEKLKNQGVQPWLDRENLLPGVDWDREIVREIRQSHFVLFCLSANSINKRGYIQKELRTALSAFDEIPTGQIYLIPVRLEDCKVPEELTKYQFADVFRDGEFEKLLRSIFMTWAETIKGKTKNAV